MQLAELRNYAAARKWTIYAEYVDSGWSSAKASRPELNRLMADARKRRFDAVCVWKLDRWGRSVRSECRTRWGHGKELDRAETKGKMHRKYGHQ
jgi:DNA invertase Pin-like site-specific DNA recombinase